MKNSIFQNRKGKFWKMLLLVVVLLSYSAQSQRSFVVLLSLKASEPRARMYESYNKRQSDGVARSEKPVLFARIVVSEWRTSKSAHIYYLILNVLTDTRGVINMSIFAGLATGLLDTVGSIFGADRQFDKQVEMWDKTNLYNSPKEQMERFAEAGLNPNLIYGQMGSTTAVPVKYGETGTNFSDSISKAYAVRNMDAQNKNLAVQNSLLGQQISESKTREFGVALDNMLKAHDNNVIMKSGYSSRDPWFLRLGGRAMNMFKNAEQERLNSVDWKPNKEEEAEMRSQGYEKVDGKWIRRSDVDYRWDGGLNIIQ